MLLSSWCLIDPSGDHTPQEHVLIKTWAQTAKPLSLERNISCTLWKSLTHKWCVSETKQNWIGGNKVWHSDLSIKTTYYNQEWNPYWNFSSLSVCNEDNTISSTILSFSNQWIWCSLFLHLWKSKEIYFLEINVNIMSKPVKFISVL